MDKEKKFLHEVLNNASFRFAKSMPYMPHWYTLRKNWSSGEDFENTVKLIRKHGVSESFYNREFIYFYSNGYKYWTMGDPVEETILINKAVAKYNTDYDSISNEYENYFTQEEFLEEDKELLNSLDLDGKVLDIGCGTGLGARECDPNVYVGIDISAEMLRIAKKNFPSHAFLNTDIKDFYTRGRFDRIIALYGTASYIPPSVLHQAILDFLEEDGIFYLMYYKEEPTTHQVFKINPTEYSKTQEGESSPLDFDGVRTVSFGNYEIVTNDSEWKTG